MSNEFASVSRRDFVAGGAGVVSASVLGGLGASLTEARADEAPIELRGNLTMADIEQSAVELDPISDFAVEETYDIVVVGAGDSGVCAVLTAVEEGATVACLQKEEAVAANGTGASAVIKGESTPAGIKRWMADWSQVNGWRTNNALFQHYVDHSEETLSWVIQRGIEAGVEPVNYEGPDSVKYDDGNVCAVIKVRQPSNLELMTALAAKAADEGAVFYYATPAVQLVQDADGTVTGVIGKQKDGTYVKLNATKGVVLAAGDYMSNASLVDRYAADTKPFWRKQANRTGDGHILGILAGGTMAPAHHARQIHGIIGPFMKTPLLMLDLAGNRFMNETAIMTDWGVQMALSGSYATPYPTLEQDYIHRFFDAALNEKYTGVPTLESIDKQIDEGTTMYYFRGDTIEDLAAQLELPAEAVQASIDRYNELAAAANDEDFGVPGSQMATIDTPPFYCIRDRPGLAAINGGVLVDANYQIVDEQGEPIPHLFGAGVNAGNVCGGINWNMAGGASDSHCFTAGRYTVVRALTGGDEPSNPCAFADIAEKFADENGNYPWQAESVKSAINPW